ncbi:DgyrCDS6680 [Dimorphilus gyrociliatus]|uniref:DgyrCDS6680 n=1 Tax=Dimorphilus gyrociliatus TaxID=2664684 RepID=A0A7I8VR11_9ANNE|nr:DgyrCDS6680 [Dimorphilus gyrociliatus]
MSKEAVEDREFERLLSEINQATAAPTKKHDLIFNSKGYFSALQASRLIYAQTTPPDKVRALKILEPRLCRMTCSEARDIINCFTIGNDKLSALNVVKRYLTDCERVESIEFILSCFPFEKDKYCALSILKTVRSDVADLMAAGGHQGYAALGSLFTQSRPLELHTYGSLNEQTQQMPGGGKLLLPALAKTDVSPSTYSGHPSYAYKQGRDYAADRGYPGNPFSEGSWFNETGGECPARPAVEGIYPTGAPLSGQHQAAQAPVGFPNDQSAEMSKVICH